VLNILWSLVAVAAAAQRLQAVLQVEVVVVLVAF
jgi:hypothetical protein